MGVAPPPSKAMRTAPATSAPLVASRCLLAVKTPSFVSEFSRLNPRSCSTLALAEIKSASLMAS